MTLVRTPTRPTRLVLAAATLAALTLAACGSSDEEATVPSDSTPAAASPSLDGTTYLSTGSTGFDLVPGSVVRIEFQQLRLSVNAGCNTMNGAYALDGDTLVAKELASTQMACVDELMKQDQTIAALLGAKPTLTVDGDTLTISDGTKTLTMLDRKVADPDQPLAGTTWTVTSVKDSNAVSSGWGTATATIVLDVAADGTGTAQVSAGCNTGSASVTVTDTAITFGPLALTRKMCDEDAMRLEQAVVATLTGTADYAIEASTLTLTNGDVGLILSAS